MSLNPSTAVARAVVAGLVTYGVKHVVLCPGSRSAPLVYALAAAADRGDLTVHVRIDERVGAFTSLGLARFAPSAVITTSGTAAANLHPALLEAREAGRGIIAITADRPHDMRGVGANQATQQVGMYGPAIPTIEIPAGAEAASVPNVMSRIAARARGAFGRPEPAHLNVAFRDPLVPEDAPAGAGFDLPHPSLGLGTISREAEIIDGDLLTVVVAGDGAGEEAARFAEALGVPLLAEPSSGARHGAVAIGPYQRILAGELGERVEQAIVFGRPTLSRPVSRLLANAAQVTVVTDRPDWVDVTGNATRIIAAAAPGTPGSEEWLAQWRAEENNFSDRGGLGADVVAEALSAGQGQVFLGSSMAIRYADIFSPAGEKYTSAPVYASRGLAGIDGTIATATGIALASGQPIRVILGDLTFAHDVGALALGPGEPEADVQIVVLNDGGGGIFKRLEHGEDRYSATFERYFATPVQMNVEEIARAYGYEYERVTEASAVAGALAEPVRGRSIVEVELPKLSGNS